MDSLSTFKIPSLISQDIALIMGYVDPPTPLSEPEPEPATCSGKPTEIKREEDEDINSSGHESGDEDVVKEILTDVPENEETKVVATAALAQEKESDSFDSESSSSGAESESDSSLDDEVSKDVKDLDRKPVTKPNQPKSNREVEMDEDGLLVPDVYVPTTHEISLSSIPVPPLPDPATLPDEPLEVAGEINTILSDTIIVRGGSGASIDYSTAAEKRHSVLDEGSLLLFDDRTPLGYVWETFGPTHLPHYIVRVARNSHISKSKVQQTMTGTETDGTGVRSVGVGIEASNASAGTDSLLNKATMFRPIYHLRSTSKFVFTQVLEQIKGSDASNLHDEELSEREQEFSDDEAEAAFKRTKRKGSRAPSVSHLSNRRQPSKSFTYPDHDNDQNYVDDASSLYGDSPYDVGGEMSDIFGNSIGYRFYQGVAAQPYQPQQYFHTISAATASSSTPSSLHQDPEIQRTLLNARMSRRKKSTSAVHPNYPQQGQQHTMMSSSSQSQSFSFEEYDPRMPRAPSPTSFAIAQATGQWSNGMPFVYNPMKNANIVSPVPAPYAASPLTGPVGSNGYHSHDYNSYPSGNVGASADDYAGIGIAPHMSSQYASLTPLPSGPPPPCQVLSTDGTDATDSFEHMNNS